MLTEDYIRRQIALASAILVSILGLKTAGQYDDALQAVDQALEQLTGLRADLLLQMDDRAFLDLLARKEVQDIERLQLLGELYRQAGEVQESRSQPTAATLHYQRALLLFVEIALNLDELPLELQVQVAELRLKLAEVELPFDTRLALLNYDELLQAGNEDR